MGFTLSEKEALEFIKKNSKNKDVLYPYLNGQDLNSSPTQKPSRWVINFWDWSIERAMQYEELFKIVEKKVKPERQRRNEKGEFVLRKPLPQNWWIYGEKQPALYHTIGRHQFFEKHPIGFNINQKKHMEYVIAFPLVTKYLSFSVIENNSVYTMHWEYWHLANICI